MGVRGLRKLWVGLMLLAIMLTGSVVGCGSEAAADKKSMESAGSEKSNESNFTDGGTTEKKDENGTGIDKTANGGNKSGESKEGEEKKSISDITIQEQVLFEQDGIRITAKELTENSLWGPELKVFAENTTETGITVQVQSMSVNGIMVTPMFSCDVAAGKSANDSITILESELKAAGVSRIQNMEIAFHVFNTENWEGIFDTEMIYLATSIDGTEEQEVDNTGQLILEQDGVTITIKEVNSEESFWGADIYVYIENNSEQNITVQTRSVSINGVMVSPMFSCEVAAGKKAFDTITFLESNLTENGIESIENMGVSFHIFNTESWESIFDSEEILVEF